MRATRPSARRDGVACRSLAVAASRPCGTSRPGAMTLTLMSTFRPAATGSGPDRRRRPWRRRMRCCWATRNARRRCHDDASVPLLDHVRPDRPGCAERPAVVDGEMGLEVVVGDIGEAGPAHDAGVVDEDVDASELLDRTVDERRAPSAVECRSCPRAPCLLRCRSHRRPRRRARHPCRARHRAAQVVDDDARATFREQVRIGATDAAPRARDDRDAPLEAELVHAPQAGTGAKPRRSPRVPPTMALRSSSGTPAISAAAAPGSRGTCPRRAGSRCPT